MFFWGPLKKTNSDEEALNQWLGLVTYNWNCQRVNGKPPPKPQSTTPNHQSDGIVGVCKPESMLKHRCCVGFEAWVGFMCACSEFPAALGFPVSSISFWQASRWSPVGQGWLTGTRRWPSPCPRRRIDPFCGLNRCLCVGTMQALLVEVLEFHARLCFVTFVANFCSSWLSQTEKKEALDGITCAPQDLFWAVVFDTYLHLILILRGCFLV